MPLTAFSIVPVEVVAVPFPVSSAMVNAAREEAMSSDAGVDEPIFDHPQDLDRVADRMLRMRKLNSVDDLL